MNSDENMSIVEEVELEARPGLPVMVMVISLYLISILLIIAGGVMMEQRESYLSIIMIVTGILYFCICWIPFMGLKILKPQEALVLTLFGKYIETLKGAGRGRFFSVNPFVVAVNPTIRAGMATATEDQNPISALNKQPSAVHTQPISRRISLKVMTFNNNKQKINDELGIHGAVDIVKMALEVRRKNITSFGEDRKAALVRNLLVILCGNRDTQAHCK